MAKQKMGKFVLVGGVLVFVLLLVLFVPAILGASSNTAALEKYNGTSDQGNETVRIAHVIDGFIVGLTVQPLTIIVIFVALLCVIVAMMYLGKSGFRKK